MFGMKKLKAGLNNSKIVFTDTTKSDLELPQPAFKFIPDWYKQMESYINKEKKPTGAGKTDATIKRCMPVFDALTAGYILTTPADVWVSIKEIDGTKTQYFEWSNYSLIEFHPVEQAPTHPKRNAYSYPKLMNPWAIKTPRGYSTLFVQPFHRESVFAILEGVVDTDRYDAPVNFPFVIKDPKFEGLIPVGTPMAQVIPFKREKWLATAGKHKETDSINKTAAKLKTRFFDGYKTFFWARKEYK